MTYNKIAYYFKVTLSIVILSCTILVLGRPEPGDMENKGSLGSSSPQEPLMPPCCKTIYPGDHTPQQFGTVSSTKVEHGPQ